MNKNESKSNRLYEEKIINKLIFKHVCLLKLVKFLNVIKLELSKTIISNIYLFKKL